MNIIRIISTKVPKHNVPEVYLPLSSLQNTLTEAAKHHNSGYISSQSYFPITTIPTESAVLYNISEWRNHDYWLDWFHSDIRAAVYSQYKILDKESHVILKARIPFNDIPLL
jgi:hypothetical protein